MADLPTTTTIRQILQQQQAILVVEIYFGTMPHRFLQHRSISTFLGLIKTNDVIIVQDANNSNNFQKWTVSATPTMQTNYVEVPVTLTSSAGTGTTNFANNHALIVAIISTGIVGPTGPVGATGPTGPIGPTGATGSAANTDDLTIQIVMQSL
jgi:hypothetical protein